MPDAAEEERARHEFELLWGNAGVVPRVFDGVSVSCRCWLMEEPKETHWKAAKRILHYVRGNVLLLRNNLDLSLDDSEVSLHKLLSLVVERLIDSNNNVYVCQDKDNGYLKNQQQNISDAIDLLPRLVIGIDVNVHFRNELVQAFEMKKIEGDIKGEEEADYIDFAAATTATLGVPSPSLSRDENKNVHSSEPGSNTDSLDIEIGDGSSIIYQSQVNNDLKDDVLAENNSLPAIPVSSTSEADSDGSGHCEKSSQSDENTQTDTTSNQVPNLQFSDDSSSNNLTAASENGQSLKQSFHDDLRDSVHENSTRISIATESGGYELSNVSGCIASSLEEIERIYEEEDCIIKSGPAACVNPEPVYEGEMVLVVQAEKIEATDHTANIKDSVVHEQWCLITNFLLFCLQEVLKEGELCIFFRNNHFSTMFKYNGELYLLATDRGYMNDLVWEKLNEVNGGTIFMTGNFVEFKADDQVHHSWNELSAMTNTADYLAALRSAGHPSALKYIFSTTTNWFQTFILLYLQFCKNFQRAEGSRQP
ncbi:hypothetical protein ZIOFF_011915 [Zingiber officinale]|uniref:MINDY deubiquitinase domain-containing protein n=1 Tax=Zingiber officinale TaxID=94328 RepID=A0A8J5I6Y8_ZINOF|nr:hypothetical protein ZIOFF_011915 [Zingiber officinale]